MKREIRRMWKKETEVTPVKIGAIRTFSKSCRKYLNYVLGRNQIKELEKATKLSMHTHNTESANVKHRTPIMGNNITCCTNCKYETVSKFYTLKTIVFQVCILSFP
jgi:hypothetical protein